MHQLFHCIALFCAPSPNTRGGVGTLYCFSQQALRILDTSQPWLRLAFGVRVGLGTVRVLWLEFRDRVIGVK